MLVRLHALLGVRLAAGGVAADARRARAAVGGARGCWVRGYRHTHACTGVGLLERMFAVRVHVQPPPIHASGGVAQARWHGMPWHCIT